MYPWQDPGRRPPRRVIEDGTPGVVRFTHAIEGGGPAILIRGARRDPLFGGAWTLATAARAYAREHGHVYQERFPEHPWPTPAAPGHPFGAALHERPPEPDRDDDGQ
ncbi:MAG: hypothetical protein AB1Z98_16755 [Nannocystaceae bacterium]